jgi:hypothetical protein
MKRVIPISAAVWVLMSVIDYTLNPSSILRGASVNIICTGAIAVSVLSVITSFILVAMYRKIDYIWWVLYPLASGILDIIYIITDMLTGLPVPNNFYWLYANPYISAVAKLFSHSIITMGTLFLSVLLSFSICTILSAITDRYKLSERVIGRICMLSRGKEGTKDWK